LQKEFTQLKKDNAQLRMAVGELSSPTRLETIAHRDLGLRPRSQAPDTVTVTLTRVP
jgi:cell division protein FtsL